MSWSSWLARAAEWDAGDALSGFRGRFHLPTGRIYLDGNSLGLLCRDAEASVQGIVHSWRDLAIEGWTAGSPDWYTLAETLGAQMAMLVGAEPDEVICTNSTTVNLHQLLATLYDPADARKGILVDSLNFPSDGYAVRSHLRLRGVDAERFRRTVPSRDGLNVEEDDIVGAMADGVQLAVLPVVQYRSGQLLDIDRIAGESRRRGVQLLLDCSHSIGIVPHSLDGWGVDGAFWCGYKYLNGGPGSAAGLYLGRKHFGARPGLAGWFGSRKETQFDMLPELDHADAAGALQIGTPNILSMAPLAGTLPMLLEAGVVPMRAKSLRMTGLMMEIADSTLTPLGFRVANPRAPERRGGHVALAHPESVRICKALRARGVVPDFRPPDIVRMAPSPLYTRFTECVEAMQAISDIVRTHAYEEFASGRETVS